MISVDLGSRFHLKALLLKYNSRESTFFVLHICKYCTVQYNQQKLNNIILLTDIDGIKLKTVNGNENMTKSFCISLIFSTLIISQGRETCGNLLIKKK